MADAKPFASLSSGLLARKGGAKPAMRPQGFSNFGGSSLEDLGWNDLGHGAEAYEGPAEHVPTPIHGLTPSPSVERVTLDPPVVEQQRALEESYAPEPEEASEAEAEQASAPVVALPLPRSQPRRERQPRLPAASGKAKSAFTLRLDADRHFKLRLACALTGRSAQLLVTDALDEFLNSLPEVDALAQRVPADAGKRSR